MEEKRYPQGTKITWKCGTPGNEADFYIITQVGYNKFMFIDPYHNRRNETIYDEGERQPHGIKESEIRKEFDRFADLVIVNGKPLSPPKCPTCQREY